MVVEVALGILLALAILFIGLPVALWLVGVVLNTVAGSFNVLFPTPQAAVAKMTRQKPARAPRSMQDWAERIVRAVIVALLLCSIPATVWVMDTLHENGIARQWAVLVPIGTIIGIFAIWMSPKENIRVSAPRRGE
jgi:hypothetical protein